MLPALPNLQPGLLSVETPEIEWRDTIYYGRRFHAAWIPSDREADFVAGEAARCMTRYVVQRTDASVRQQWKKKVYWCSYGPSDLRNRVEGDEQTVAGAPRKRRRTEPSCKRGCQAHFEVMSFSGHPDRIHVWLRKTEHVDVNKVICHGPECEEAGRHTSAPGLSDETRSWVRKCIAAGLSTKQVVHFNQHKYHLAHLQQHNLPSLLAAQQDLEAQTRGKPRDYLLDPKDVYNIGRRLEKLEWELDADQAGILQQLQQQIPQNLLCLKFGAEDSLAFLWSNPELLEIAAESAHKRALFLDSTSTELDLKIPVFTVTVVDQAARMVPVAWMAAARLTREAIQECLKVIVMQCSEIKPGFHPACAVTDTSYTTHLAFRRAIPGVPVLISLHHTKQAWDRALEEKVQEEDTRQKISEALGRLLSLSVVPPLPGASGGQHLGFARGEMQRLYQKFEGEAAFVDFLKRDWEPKLEMWFPSSGNSPELCRWVAAKGMEGYHNVFKELILNDRMARLQSLRLDWLIHMTLAAVDLRYLPRQDETCPARSTYRRALERKVGALVSKAISIPDSQVVLPSPENDVAGVTHRGEVQHVLLPGTSQAICTCLEAMEGHVCEHIMKVAMCMDARVNAELLLQYLGRLGGTPEGGLTALYNSLKARPEAQFELPATAALQAPPNAAQASASAPSPCTLSWPTSLARLKASQGHEPASAPADSVQPSVAAPGQSPAVVQEQPQLFSHIQAVASQTAAPPAATLSRLGGLSALVPPLGFERLAAGTRPTAASQLPSVGQSPASALPGLRQLTDSSQAAPANAGGPFALSQSNEPIRLRTPAAIATAPMPLANLMPPTSMQSAPLPQAAFGFNAQQLSVPRSSLPDDQPTDTVGSSAALEFAHPSAAAVISSQAVAEVQLPMPGAVPVSQAAQPAADESAAEPSHRWRSLRDRSEAAAVALQLEFVRAAAKFRPNDVQWVSIEVAHIQAREAIKALVDAANV